MVASILPKPRGILENEKTTPKLSNEKRQCKLY